MNSFEFVISSAAVRTSPGCGS